MVSRPIEQIDFHTSALAAQNLFPDVRSFAAIRYRFHVQNLPEVHVITRKAGHLLDSGRIFPERCSRIHRDLFRCFDEPFTQFRFQTFSKYFFCAAPGKFFTPARHLQLITRIFMLKINPPVKYSGLDRRNERHLHEGSPTPHLQKLAGQWLLKVLPSHGAENNITQQGVLNQSPCCTFRISLFVIILQAFSLLHEFLAITYHEKSCSLLIFKLLNDFHKRLSIVAANCHECIGSPAALKS